MFRRKSQDNYKTKPIGQSGLDQFLETIADGKPIPRTEEEAAIVIQAGLQQSHKRLSDRMNANYAVVRELHHVRVSGRAALTYLAEAMPAFENDLVESEFAEAPIVAAILERIRDYFQLPPDQQDPLELFRRSLSRQAMHAKLPEDRQAGYRVLALYDQVIDRCVDGSAIARGTEKHAVRWRDAAGSARESRRKLSELFEPRTNDDIAGKVIQEILTGRQTPARMVTGLMGKGPYGTYGPGPHIARRLKEALQNEPYSWLSLLVLAAFKLMSDSPDPDTMAHRLHGRGAELTQTLSSQDEKIALVGGSGAGREL